MCTLVFLLALQALISLIVTNIGVKQPCVLHQMMQCYGC